MIVRPASRNRRAISLGVFCRLRAFDQGDHAVEKGRPGLAVMRTTSQSERTCVPPVTVERSPPVSRMTGARFAGDRAFIDRGDALDRPRRRRERCRRLRRARRRRPCRSSAETATSLVLWPGAAHQPLGGHVAAGAAQRVGLGLAAPFRHRLGEIGEQHREPQPRRDLPGEGRGARMGYRIAREHGHDGRDDLGDEDHRIVGEAARIEFFHGVESGAL